MNGPGVNIITYGQDLEDNGDASVQEQVITFAENIIFTQVPVPLEISSLPAILVIGGVVAIAHFKGKG